MDHKIEIQTALEEIKSSITGVAERQTQMQTQVDAIDLQGRQRHTNDPNAEDMLVKALGESDELKRLVEMGKGCAIIRLGDLNAIPMQRKILTGGSMTGTAGVVMPERVGSIVPLASRRLFLRDLLFRGSKTTGNQVYFVKEQTFVNGASPQAGEGAVKSETTMSFTTVSLPIQTLAHHLNASKQVLEDVPTLAAYISTRLLYGLRYREEVQCISGDGTGNNLSGLIGQASPFNLALLTGVSHTPLDILRRALEQVELADEVPAGFFCLSPVDIANIELLKDTLGRYIVGDPGGTAEALSLWGKPVISTTAITPGTFLAGSSESAELVDRLDATVELSYEDRDNFIRNAVTILCEERTVLCTYRPGAFVTGTLNSSPA
ncbi:phage major capsid protein [Granulicella sp. dw_53]|uniref:phage major capsid protein n=1 Tax=Granulicella sp. dw_53 TaxID=2719792 RepID=UPI00210825ED|nr:phage major capsid protein [Granulicella sp. dw_53]